MDRYGAVRYHGLFLFLSSGDFPAFIEDHWRDLHHLTGDDLDIYFSEKDLSERSSGYELVAKLKEVQLRVDALPALLLWEDRLDGSVTVPLQGLEHGQIIDVMKAVVQGIRNGCTLSAIADRGTECAERIRNCVDHGVLIQRGATLLINNGGVMTEYKNYGQAGAFGEKPRSDNNRFLQSAPSEPIDLDELAKQLGQVREEMKRTANPDDADQDTEIGLLAQAEKAAKSGDRSRTLEFLKSAGNWTVEVAKSAAAGLVKDAVEGKFGS